MLFKIAQMLILLEMFVYELQFNFMMLNETPTLKVLFMCKKNVSIMDRMCIFQLPECVLSIILTIPAKIVYRRISGFH